MVTWGIILIHLMYVLALNSRIPEVTLGKPCVGVDARLHPTFSSRNLGALFEVLCVGLSIMNLNLLWCYFSTNSWIDRSERIALRWFRTVQTISSYVLRLIRTLE